MKNIAVVLSGCGAKDGTEITEAVSTLLTLSELKVGYEIFAPNLDFPSTHHLTLEDQNPRNALAEAARIARGKIKDLQLLEVKSFDGLVFPGGYGVARNLCDWVKKGAQCQVLPQVRHIIEEFFAQS
ncbi:MAG: isoprenoid biosynthesis protein ElbB, partial [Bdellovibrionales bacterium]|nr:isoprenoid biosynthesis protein ElbB [Bdellovibrionales bacterium]